MTTERDFDRIASAWLTDGPERLSDRVLDAVVDEIHVTPQRHAQRLPWRFPSMTTPARVAAAALIGVLALGGVLYTLGPVGSRFGGPGPTPSPTPTPLALVEGPLAAGRYVTTPFADAGDGHLGVCATDTQPGCTENPADDTIRILFTLPEGWVGSPRHSVSTPTLGSPDGAWLVFERGGSLYTDPCHSTPPPSIAVGPSVDDFANALVAHPTLDVTTPVDVTLAGYRGKAMDLRVPADISSCLNGPTEPEYWPWEPGFRSDAGSRWHLWILDVNDIRVVIHGIDYAATSALHQSELRGIVDSIQIEP